MSITYINDVLNQFPFPSQEVDVAVVTPPIEEPVSLDTFKAHVQIDYEDDSQDTLIAAYISAARGWCETYCKRSFAVKTLAMTLDYFPPDGQPIHLRRPPVQSVTSIHYIDTNGDQQTLDPSQYFVNLNATSPRIATLPNVNWPTTSDQIASVTITYVVGYPDTEGSDPQTTVPAEVIAAILMIAADLWGNRFQQQTMSEGGELFKNPTVEALLSTYRTF